MCVYPYGFDYSPWTNFYHNSNQNVKRGTHVSFFSVTPHTQSIHKKNF